MAFTNLNVQSIYQGDGVVTTFAIPFNVVVDDSAETKVYIRDETDSDNITETLQVEGALQDYTLTGAPTADSFHTDVEFNTAPTATQKVLVKRELPFTQILDLVNSGSSRLENQEEAYDRLVAMVQQLDQKLKRAILKPLTTAELNHTLEEFAGKANGVLAVNATANGVEILSLGDLASAIAVELGAGSLPLGGDTGAVLTKDSAADNDAVWTQYAFDGFSARFNAAFSSINLQDTLAKILNIQYTAPLISLSASGNSLREKGDAVTSTTLTASITRRSDPIAEVRFTDVTGGNTLLDTQTSGGAIPNGGNSTYNWTGSFSDTQQFRASVDDNGDTGGPTTVNATVTFNFVYPYYVGAGAASLSAANVAALTKRIINSTASRNETITAGAGEVFYFAYPASYGALTSILDVNNFETIGSWTLRTENITGLDSTPVSYRIYEFNNPVTAGSYEYTFIR